MAFRALKKFSQTVSQEFARLVEERWRELANERLDTSRDAYLAAIRVEVTGTETVETKLVFGKGDGTRVSIVEYGQRPWNMRQSILGPRNVFGRNNNASKRLSLKQPGGGSNVARMSWNSTAKWKHPGVEGRNLMQQVRAEAPKLHLEAVRNVLADAAGKAMSRARTVVSPFGGKKPPKPGKK